jgi:sterol desaturase/sphingolipid hydroxylase (fatty acid hydroxylase superfamily)
LTRAAIFIAVGALFWILERLRPAREWPAVRGWWWRTLVVSGFQLAFVLTAGLAWEGGLGGHRLWSADFLGPWGGGAVGYLAITFVNYWWHRARHDVPFVWRWLHQLHHSPERIELLTSFYRHPIEVLINSALMSLVLYAGVGTSPEAAANAVLLVGLVDMFYHTNTSTPRWLGFIVQRPESHCVHHLLGVHSYNFADLAIWDMLFGTFRNPARFNGECGFGPGAEARVGAMLLGRDIVPESERVVDGIKRPQPEKAAAPLTSALSPVRGERE